MHLLSLLFGKRHLEEPAHPLLQAGQTAPKNHVL